MKVLYDVSVLGMGHVFPRARTGVFRVVENVARELILQPGCDIKFCSDSDIKTIDYSLSYLKDHKYFSNVPFSLPPLYKNRLRLSSRKEALINQITGTTITSQADKLRIRWKIKEFILKEKIYNIYNNGFIDPVDVKDADIYHSPYYALPRKTSSSYKSVFFTCYDLIPILFPQFFEQSIIDVMKDILTCITPETWVLCISESTRTDLLNYLGKKVSAERVLVTELAASDTFYKSTDKLRNSEVRKRNNIPDGPYILSLCTFEPRKNIEQVVKAFSRIIAQENIPDLRLVLVGSKGWLFEKIFEQISSRPDIKNRIIITGFIPDEDLASLYSEAQLFVYPSFYEGFGLPPLEAMKCGTPVITSNVSSLPEVVGDAGLMVAPSDLDGLCGAILKIYKNPGLQEEMSKKSLQRAGYFSWQRCARETAAAYQTSLSS